MLIANKSRSPGELERGGWRCPVLRGIPSRGIEAPGRISRRSEFFSQDNATPLQAMRSDMARPKQKLPNPISTAVKEWLERSFAESNAIGADEIEVLASEAPKRWVVYEPMVLLPSGSFAGPRWTDTLASVSEDARDALWRTILRKICERAPHRATHLAVNDGIPPTVAAAAAHDDDAPASENVLRSPIGLRTMYGDFGPAQTRGRAVDAEQDFARAFWVSTRQNGIYQTWAPRWTMFSRGNVKEKARLLAFHEPRQPVDGEAVRLAHRARPASSLRRTWAVDLYAGIGYFVFSYARLGMRALCWELNPWSVEGLRRGAEASGWPVKVVQGEALRRPTAELVLGDEAIVVFLEDNREAARRVRELRSHGLALSVSHVNCGLLPKSDDSWEPARDILGEERDGWLHLHENVGVKDIEHRRDEIQSLFDRCDQRDGIEQTATVEHVELVKTFAPAVWHCVFDVYITKPKSNITPR